MGKEYLAVIQAGGKGTRMKSLTLNKIPKPMLLINGKPMLQWQIENLLTHGIRDICIITGYLGEKIEAYFGDGTKYGANISYIREDKPLGSAGALYFIKGFTDPKDIILIFGDVMIKIDWDRMIAFHEQRNALVTCLIHPNAHPYDSDLVLVNSLYQVIGIDPKNSVRQDWYDNLVNAGIYIIDSEILCSFDKAVRKDFEKDILCPLIKTGRVFGYKTSEYVKDAGTPERFQSCCEEQRKGLWDDKCLNKKQKAIFFDRDGTLNQYRGLISNADELELECDAASAVREINRSGYLAFCVTNQPVVARGLCDVDEVYRIHRKLQTLLGRNGAYLDDIVFCPHHPDKGYKGENPLYKIPCNCRKPSTGLIEQLVETYHIDLAKSWVVGDTTVDMQLGKNVGAQTILLKTGQAGNDGKYNVTPDYEAKNLTEAVSIIIHAYGGA